MRIALFSMLATLAFGQNRIVSTSPASTEILFALGLGGRVVGVSDYCHYPLEATRKPRIGSYLKPNAEAILRLRPDLVIIERLPNRAIEQLQGSGVRVQPILTGDLAANLLIVETIARATNTVDRGRALASEIRAALARVEANAKGLRRRSVLFIVGRTPGRLEGMVAVGKGSYLNELIAIAGGRNLLADSPLAYPKISLESVLRLKPDVIVDMGDMADTQGVTERHKQSVVGLWTSQREIKTRIHAVANDIFVVPGPRMAEAAAEFLKLIHPEAARK